MKVYIGHSRAYDYESLLYRPIRNAIKSDKVEIILPHENGDNQNNRDFYASLDLFIAEVSYPATGLGIELGWAYDNNVPIVCIYRDGVKISGSLKAVTSQFYSYSDEQSLIQLIQEILTKK